MNEYLNQRIVQKFISNIYKHRTSIQNQFAIRNNSAHPELKRQIIEKEIRDLRMWRHLLTLLDADIKWQIQNELDNLKIK